MSALGPGANAIELAVAGALALTLSPGSNPCAACRAARYTHGSGAGRAPMVDVLSWDLLSVVAGLIPPPADALRDALCACTRRASGGN